VNVYKIQTVAGYSGTGGRFVPESVADLDSKTQRVKTDADFFSLIREGGLNQKSPLWYEG
jgi:hypothetical protein